MKTLGIIGGLGPESTIDYYGRIIALYRERTGDGSYPQFIINSINMKKGLDFMEANNLTGMAEYLLEEIGKLARAGATFGLISQTRRTLFSTKSRPSRRFRWSVSSKRLVQRPKHES